MRRPYRAYFSRLGRFFLFFVAIRGWLGPPPTNFFEMQHYEASVRTADFIVLMMLIIVGLFIRRFRKRIDIERQSAEEVLLKDPRKPILYLRALTRTANSTKAVPTPRSFLRTR